MDVASDNGDAKFSGVLGFILLLEVCQFSKFFFACSIVVLIWDGSCLCFNRNDLHWFINRNCAFH